MAAPIENPAQLRGRKLHDQDGASVGEVIALYGLGEEREPMWAAVQSSLSAAQRRVLLVPLARLKEEDGQLRAPYSKRHLHESPQVSPGDELAAEDERRLRDFYAIDLADGEQRVRGVSYAARVAGQSGSASRLEG